MENTDAPHFVGLEVPKQVIAFWVKSQEGEIVSEGKLPATRSALSEWAQALPQPGHGAKEATWCSHWIYRHLEAYSERLEMGHPARRKAISAGPKKTDPIDARTIADLLRCHRFPSCWVISPELAGLRQHQRFRRLRVEETVRFKNHTAGLLMSAGVEYQRRQLHGKRYYQDLLPDNQWISQELKPWLKFHRQQIETRHNMERRLLRMLQPHPQLQARAKALPQIDGVGLVTALTWILETGTPERCASIGAAVSYCGWSSALRESAGHARRGP